MSLVRPPATATRRTDARASSTIAISRSATRIGRTARAVFSTLDARTPPLMSGASGAEMLGVRSGLPALGKACAGVPADAPLPGPLEVEAVPREDASLSLAQ